MTHWLKPPTPSSPPPILGEEKRKKTHDGAVLGERQELEEPQEVHDRGRAGVQVQLKVIGHSLNQVNSPLLLFLNLLLGQAVQVGRTALDLLRGKIPRVERDVPDVRRSDRRIHFSPVFFLHKRLGFLPPLLSPNATRHDAQERERTKKKEKEKRRKKKEERRKKEERKKKERRKKKEERRKKKEERKKERRRKKKEEEEEEEKKKKVRT